MRALVAGELGEMRTWERWCRFCLLCTTPQLGLTKVGGVGLGTAFTGSSDYNSFWAQRRRRGPGQDVVMWKSEGCLCASE